MPKEICRYEIRFAYPWEWESITAFAWDAFLKSMGEKCTEEGKTKFYRFITDCDLQDSFRNGEYPVMLAVCRGGILGMASIRCHNHLSLLFVESQHRRQGIGRALMGAVMQHMRNEGEKYVSLQAESDAVNFYRKLGFRSIRPEENDSGIRTTGMERLF